MKNTKMISLLILIALIRNSYAQTHSQCAEVISSGGGMSTGGNYTNFSVLGETFVNSSMNGGSYSGRSGYIYKDCENIVNAIKEIDFVTELDIFPNPTTGNFILEMELTQPEPLDLYILNSIGQVVYNEELGNHIGSYQKTIDLNRHAKGVYLLQVAGKEGVMGRKIVLY